MNYQRAYERCVRLGQWQNAANMRGCSVDQVRRENEARIKRSEVEEGSDIDAAPKPFNQRVWAGELIRRLRSASVTRADLARRLRISGATLRDLLEGGAAVEPEMVSRIDLAVADLARFQKVRA